ncbi:MAG: NUDIX hydrolase [Proteobacteria bacterium SG_bin5]|nr:NUDIX domain-containing protein [Sphingomonas sp.]OQW43712.1 MAG: NUDIX hydrolase [Proteobacteria bacterium SG_bin5]
MIAGVTEPIPAATLILFREAEGAPELLMVERARAMAFAGGALVFPGGRIDPEDEALALRLAPGDPLGAARVAALRELLEEAGVALGLAPVPDAALIARLRDRLHGGAPFGALLAEHGLSLTLDALTPFARWCPRHANMRIFDTHFFIAPAPEDARVEADGGESVRAFWGRARDILAEAEGGRASLIFPTRRNLERLARFASFAEALADARAHPIETITPWIERRDGIDYLRIPEGLGYPVTEEALADARRD